MKSETAWIIENQKGSALVLVLVLVTILLLVGAAALKVSSNTVNANELDTKKTEALYVAESAISVNKAIIDTKINDYLELKKTNPTPSFSDLNLQNIHITNGTYDLRLSLNDASKDQFQLVVTGYVKDHTKNNVVKKITVLFSPATSGQDSSHTPEDSKLASVYSSGIYSLTDIDLGHNSVINGNVAYGGEVDDHKASIKGTSIFLPTPVYIPTLDPTLWVNVIQNSNGGTVIHGTKSIGNNANTSISNTYITGDLKIDNNVNVKLSGLIYVDGDIEIGNNVTITGNGSIVSEGEFEIGSNFTVLGNTSSPEISIISLHHDDALEIKNNAEICGVIIAPYGDIEMGENAKVFGSVIGEKIEFDNNAKISYSLYDYDSMYLPGVDITNLGNQSHTVSESKIMPGYQIVEWNE